MRTVSLGSVAVAVGLAKSNVVRYFGTREEIYLELAAESWTEWGAEAAERLRAASGQEDIVAALTETLAGRPLFCDLLSHTSTTLEHNISVPAARAFKRVVLGVLADLGGDIVRAHGGLTEREGFEVVAAATALAGTLYPVANPPPALAQLYAEDPDLAAACPEFLPTLKRALSALVAGLPTLR